MSSTSAATTPMASPPHKRVKLEDDSTTKSTKVLGTHSGTFQADEAMGIFLLRQLPEYRHARVIRSRDIDLLTQQADIIIDVGGVYDHSQKRYDHHQRGYDERWQDAPDRCTKLSAAGLVYRHYGRRVLQQYYPTLDDPALEWAYLKIYDKLLQALDAIDTGVEAVPEGVTLLYKDTTGLASRVGRLNPRWNERTTTNTDAAPDPDERFEQAVTLCGQDFVAVAESVVESDWPARSFVETAVLQRLETDASGEILAFHAGGMPWRDHLYQLEKEHQLTTLVKFVLYQDQAGMWRIQAVTVEGQAFVNRLSLPEAWRGLRDDELRAVIPEAPSARFVHAAGFIGGADQYKDVLQMARLALAAASASSA